MAEEKARGLRRLVRAFGYSMQGFRACLRHEQAFRLEVVALAVLTPVALVFGDGAVERALLLSSFLLVPLVELLNSGIEAAVDLWGEERHELAGRAKDIGSAAVLLALVDALIVWGLLLVG